MEGTNMGQIPVILLAVLVVFQIVIIGFVVNLYRMHERLKKSYASFMRGKNGKNLEESILDHFSRFDAVESTGKNNREDIEKLQKTIQKSIQKFSMVKYNAFQDMDNNLSFVITLLDGNHNGLIFNVLNTGEHHYLYLKEILKGESYIELSDEEKEGLERAIYQDVNGVAAPGKTKSLIKEQKPRQARPAAKRGNKAGMNGDKTKKPRDIKQ